MRIQISINRLKLRARHGVGAQEQKVGNTFCVSVDLTVNYPDEMPDEIGSTVSYADVCALVSREMQRPSALIEHVAARIARAIAAQWPQAVCGGRVSVSKLTPPMPYEVEEVSATAEITAAPSAR
jgi:dihydroneopterin aldolase